MNYSFITSPHNKKKFSIFKSSGKSILKNYLKQLIGGAEPLFIEYFEPGSRNERLTESDPPRSTRPISPPIDTPNVRSLSEINRIGDINRNTLEIEEAQVKKLIERRLNQEQMPKKANSIPDLTGKTEGYEKRGHEKLEALRNQTQAQMPEKAKTESKKKGSEKSGHEKFRDRVNHIYGTGESFESIDSEQGNEGIQEMHLPPFLPLTEPDGRVGLANNNDKESLLGKELKKAEDEKAKAEAEAKTKMLQQQNSTGMDKTNHLESLRGVSNPEVTQALARSNNMHRNINEGESTTIGVNGTPGQYRTDQELRILGVNPQSPPRDCGIGTALGNCTVSGGGNASTKRRARRGLFGKRGN